MEMQSFGYLVPLNRALNLNGIVKIEILIKKWRLPQFHNRADCTLCLVVIMALLM